MFIFSISHDEIISIEKKAILSLPKCTRTHSRQSRSRNQKHVWGLYPGLRLEGEVGYWRGWKGIGGTLRGGVRGIYELIYELLYDH